MKKLIITSIFFCNAFFINAVLGQNQQKAFTQSNFEKNKIYDTIYQLRWYKNIWLPNAKDSLPYFVDDRNYKGIINYGVTFRSKDYKSYYLSENRDMCSIKVQITKCNYNVKDSIINIEGLVTGQIEKQKRNGIIRNDIELFIGEKTDTINNYYLGNALNYNIFSKDLLEIKLHSKEIDEFTTLDSFPAFCFKSYYNSSTAPRGPHPFIIKGKVKKNTLFAVGSRSHYSQIFDLGSMIYDPDKNMQKKYSINDESDCRTIITENKLVSAIEKTKTQEPNYYTYTKKAEFFLPQRQFAKASEQYNLLNQKYPILFARDIHNAIRCSILTRDFKSAFVWGEKLAYKGIGLSYFNAKIFNGIRKSPQWKNFTIKYDSIFRITENNLNLKLKKEINNLLVEDQAAYGLENRKDPKMLYETTERVTEKLNELLKKDGYPSEEKIGCNIVRDTILVPVRDFTVLIRHANQQNTPNLNALNLLLDKSFNILEFDQERNNIETSPANSCFHIYKGNLYKKKSCGRNDLMVRKMSFMISNPSGFIMDYENFIVVAYEPESAKEWDNYYNENFNFIMKITDDWKSYEN